MSFLDEIYDLLPNALWHGHYISSFCPFPQHHDNQKRRSLLIYEDYFKCLSCEAQGHPNQLLRLLSTDSAIIREEPEPFRNPWNSWLRHNSISEICERAARLVRDHPSQNQYWKKRGLTAKAIKKLNLGWLDGWNLIPVQSEKGKIIGATARASDTLNSVAKYCSPSSYHQDSSALLYVPSYKRLKKRDKLYLAFGPISAISLYLAGYASASPLSGKKVDPAILNAIRKPIVIVPDAKEEIDAIKLANRLSWRGSVKLLPYHDTILDPNDCWLYEPEILNQLEST